MMFPKDKKVRLKGKALQQLYAKVMERDECCCHECGSFHNVEIHHIKFKSQGGSDSLENLVCLCQEHHASRHGINIIKH